MSSKHLLGLMLALFMLLPAAYAADPGHSASAIGPGTFENGNFTFPDNLYITENLGIGTIAPTVKLEVVGAINASQFLLNGTKVCLSNGTYCPAGAVDQNLFATFQADDGSTTANSPTDTLTINGSTKGIDVNISGDVITINFDGSELLSETIAEDVINFTTACAAGSHLFINNGDLSCEADDDQPDSDAEVPNAITIDGGVLGNNSVKGNWTTIGNLQIGDDGDIIVIAATNIDLTAAGKLNVSSDIQIAGTQVCREDGINCPAGAIAQDLWETITTDTGNVKADTTTDNLTINGSGQGIDVNLSGDIVTISFDPTELRNEAIAEDVINFTTACATGNHLFINNGDLSCETDDDQPDDDSEVPNAITIDGGLIGNNSIRGNLTTTGNLKIGDGGDRIDIDSDSWDITAGAISGLTGLTVASGTVILPIGQINTTEIYDGTVTEIDLNITNTAADNQVLTYNSTTGGFTWRNDQVGVSQNVWFTITTDTGNVKANSATDNLTINGSGQGIDVNLSGDIVTISFDPTELRNEAIAEDVINFTTACATGNHLFINNGDLSCETDDDQPDDDSEVPNAITIDGGALGNNTIQGVLTQTGNLNISPGANDLYIDVDTLVVEGDDGQVGIGTISPSKKLEVSNGTQGITFDPVVSNPIINTTGGKDLIIASSGGDVIIRVG